MFPSLVLLSAALAADQHPITFSKIVLEVDSRTIAESDAEVRSAVLSAMKEAGLNVVGGESAVFEIDKSGDARFILGARLVGANHRLTARYEELQLALVWELLDARSAEIVYEVGINGYASGRPHIRSRLAEDLAVGAAAASGVIILTPPASSAQSIPNTLFWAAFEDGVDRLLARPAFTELLAAPPEEAPAPESSFDALSVKRCADARALPADLSAAITSVVSLSDGTSSVPVGSGVILSPDGWLITAAHVSSVLSEPKVRLSQGMSLPARVVRADERTDVALLKLDGEGYPCSPLASQPAPVGAELWAVGTPLGENALSLSVTRGIISGMRLIDGVERLQTDASINPGFSGGPMLLTDGTIAAITSSKIVGTAVEGVSFGAPAGLAAKQLGLSFGDLSDPAPELAIASVPEREPLRDTADPSRMGELSPELHDQMHKSAKTTLTAGLTTAAAGALMSGVALGMWTSNTAKTSGEVGQIRALDATGFTILLVGGSIAAIGGANLYEN